MFKPVDIKSYFNEQMSELSKLTTHKTHQPTLRIIDATNLDDVANQIYIKKKVEDFEKLGWKATVVKVETQYQFMLAMSDYYGVVDNIIVQMPTRKDINWSYQDIPKRKDCDGLNVLSGVTPATVRGILDYLDYCGFEYEGKDAIVIGRSDIVGKPMARALTNRDMTVTLCHSKTNEHSLNSLLVDADLVVCATNVPGLIHRCQCPNAFVVDVGISRVDGKLKGNFIEEDYGELYAKSTPVPGGVGLLTRLGLLYNCYDLTYGVNK